jgi:hypothetical protein
MKRLAILIESSDVKGLRDLPGAREDIQNWKDYLRTKLGGSWLYSENVAASEIVILRKPMSSDVQKLLEQNKHKYCFVAFAGHGFHDKNRGDYVCLNDYNKDCPLAFITPQSIQGTLVVDACRGFEDAHVVSSIQKSASHVLQNIIIANEATEVRSLNAESVVTSFSNAFYGELNWSKYLEKCGTGIVTMLSCAKGEAADDIRVNDVEVGGIYTTILMRSAQQWKKLNQYSHIYMTDEAHAYAVKYMADKFKEQHPEYSPQGLAYPFAVK